MRSAQFQGGWGEGGLQKRAVTRSSMEEAFLLPFHGWGIWCSVKLGSDECSLFRGICSLPQLCVFKFTRATPTSSQLTLTGRLSIQALVTSLPDFSPTPHLIYHLQLISCIFLVPDRASASFPLPVSMLPVNQGQIDLSLGFATLLCLKHSLPAHLESIWDDTPETSAFDRLGTQSPISSRRLSVYCLRPLIWRGLEATRVLAILKDRWIGKVECQAVGDNYFLKGICPTSHSFKSGFQNRYPCLLP